MKYSAVFPLLIACPVTVHAYINNVFSVRDSHTDDAIWQEDSDSFPTLGKDGAYEEFLRRSHQPQEESEQLSTQWEVFNTRSSNHRSSMGRQHIPAARLFARFENSRLVQQSTVSPLSTNPNLPTGVYTRDVEQEDLITLHIRNPTKDASSSRGSRDTRNSRPASPRISEQRTSTSGNQGQQQTPTGRRRVHVLQPLTSETLWQIGVRPRDNHISGDSRRDARDSEGSRLRRQQQRQQDSPNSSIPLPASAPPIPLARDRSQNRAQVSAQRVGSLRESSSTSSVNGKSDNPTAVPDGTNHEPEVESRPAYQNNGSRVTSPSQISSRRRQREELNQSSQSVTNSERSTIEQTGRRVVDGPVSPSSSENGPITRHRRLQRRSSGFDDQQQNYLHTTSESPIQPSRHILSARGITYSSLLTRFGLKKQNRGPNRGSRARSSRPLAMPASSSSNSLRASKGAAQSSEGSQKQQKGLAPSTSTESTAQSAGPSQTQSRSSRRRKARQKSQLPDTGISPFKRYAYIYDKKSSHKQDNKAPSSQTDTSTKVSPIKISRAGSGGELSRSSSLASFSSAISRTSSGSSLKSFFSAKSDDSPNLTPPESPRSSIARSQASRSRSQSPLLSKPPSPFADIRAQESQSVPSPTSNRRPSPFANAHSRAYSAPDLTSYSRAQGSSLSHQSSAASSKANISASLPPPGSPPSSAPLPGTRHNTPASAISWRTQEPYYSRTSGESIASSTLSDTLRNTARIESPLLGADRGSSNQRSPDRGSLNQASSSDYPSPPREKIIPAFPTTPLTQERPSPPLSPPSSSPLPLRPAPLDLPRNLDPVITQPSFRFGPVGSPVRGSPTLGTSRRPAPRR